MVFIAEWCWSQAGLTPLLVAAMQDNTSLMTTLIAAKADQTAKDPKGNTARALAEAAAREKAAAAAAAAAAQKGSTAGGGGCGGGGCGGGGCGGGGCGGGGD